MTKYKYLQDKALKLRQDTYNAFIDTGEAHVGGSFSMIEALLALHEEIMRRGDKFILSKAHASYPYQIYLRSRGYNPKITTHLELDKKIVYIAQLVAWVMDFLWLLEWRYPEKRLIDQGKYM